VKIFPPEYSTSKKLNIITKLLTGVLWSSVVSSVKAWLVYMRHPARDAGLGLAFLYMTVLGFDNITWGYCLSQCVTESILGAMVGVSAIFGVLGSVTFPFLRKRVGLNKSGVVGTFFQTTALSMCVVSVWLLGSPFDVYYYQNGGISGEGKKSFLLKNDMSNQTWNLQYPTNETSLLEQLSDFSTNGSYNLQQLLGNSTNETSFFEQTIDSFTNGSFNLYPAFDNSTIEGSFFELENNLTTNENATDPNVDSECYIPSYASGTYY
jgi:hypothetical protein